MQSLAALTPIQEVQSAVNARIGSKFVGLDHQAHE